MRIAGGKYLTPGGPGGPEAGAGCQREKEGPSEYPRGCPGVPVRERPSDVQCLARAVKGAAPYVAASVCLFWWELNGQIDSDTAMPALVLCALMVGGVFGKHMARR